MDCRAGATQLSTEKNEFSLIFPAPPVLGRSGRVERRGRAEDHAEVDTPLPEPV